MNNNQVKTGEILFIKSVKDGIPNRDPLHDSDARRIFGEDDGRISLSDVSIKRDVRDYILAKYPDGGSQKNMGVFVRKEFTEDHKLKGRDRLAQSMIERAGKDPKKSDQSDFMATAYDARIFGVVFSVGGKAFNQCGPVQFGWAHSLHPVDTKYVQGTVVMPSRDVEIKTESGEEEGATQGTIWTTYILPFAVFAMPAVLNASIAKETKMSNNDLEILLEALWRGTLARQARGRGIQQPLFLLHVEYKDDFFRLGFLEEGIKIQPDRQVWLGSQPPTSLNEIKLDVSALADRLNKNKDKIQRIRLWLEPQLALQGKIEAEISQWK